jgi:hypothetical protein
VRRGRAEPQARRGPGSLASVFLGALACLAVAAPASAGSSISDVQTAVSSSTAAVRWTTPTPSRGRVAFGVGDLTLYSAREVASRTAHEVDLRDLSPATTYTYEIQSTAGTSSGTFATQPPSAAPVFGVSGTHVTADGSLFFPVLSYEQCVDTVDRAIAAGVNTFVQVPFAGCADPADTSPPFLLSDDYAGGRGIGWYLPDEPDGWGIAPEQLPHLPPASETGRLRVLNLTQHFFSGQAPINDRFDRNAYQRFTALADVVGFDLYPVVKFCGRVSLLDVFRAQRELMTVYAPGKPTFQWIETSAMTGECETMTITPQIVNAEMWLAVAGGACGLGYFTNSFTSGRWNRWDFAPGVERQLSETVARIEQLAPALCTDVGSVVVPWDGTVAATSRTLNGALYVIAVNSSAQSVSVPFRIDAAAGRSLRVLGEARTLPPVKQSIYRDRFGPYEVHVYLAPPR